MYCHEKWNPFSFVTNVDFRLNADFRRLIFCLIQSKPDTAICGLIIIGLAMLRFRLICRSVDQERQNQINTSSKGSTYITLRIEPVVRSPSPQWRNKIKTLTFSQYIHRKRSSRNVNVSKVNPVLSQVHFSKKNQKLI